MIRCSFRNNCRNFKETKERLDGIISVNFNEDYEGTHFIHDRDIMHSRCFMQARNFNFAIQTFQVCLKVSLDLLVSFQGVSEFRRYIASQFATGDSSFIYFSRRHFYHLNNFDLTRFSSAQIRALFNFRKSS